MLKFFITLVLLISNAQAFDQNHEQFDTLLKEYVTRVNGQSLVDYKNMPLSRLKNYTNSLEEISLKQFESFSSPEKLAFWINAYNAYTLLLIKENYSPKLKSIKDLGSLFSSPWSKKFITLFGKKMSLDDIEHETIRKNFKEARIHFAVNCASIGCPSLLERAFVPNKLEVQLEEVTSLFLKNKNKNFYDKQSKTLRLSKIFDWYGKDFVKYHGSVEEFVKKYIEFPHSSKIEFLDYDWDLNKK